MTKYSPASNSDSLTSTDRGRLLRYLALGLVANAVVWGAALLFLKVTKPTYTSGWTLAIPAGGDVSSVNVPGLGSASAQNKSPFGNNAFDPRENYNNIIASGPVLDAATERLRSDPKIKHDPELKNVKVRKPRIEIVDNTTQMGLSIDGETPEVAQKAAIALNEAFQARLNELRLQETARQEAGIQTLLSSARKKLEDAQQRLSDYKARSGFVSNDQIVQLSSNIEGLREKRAEAIATQQQTGAQLGQLSSNLNLAPSGAAEAFVLKADPLFQQYLLSYSEANGLLVGLNSKFGPNHPVVIRERNRQEAALTALLNRSRTLLGRNVDQNSLAQLNIGSGNSISARESLFQDLVRNQVNQQGYSAQAQELGRQINQLENRLSLLAKQGATLDALNRDMQIAEAVFSSTLARLDVSKSQVFGSYPPTQALVEPDLPDGASSPNKKAVLLGAALSSLFIISALISFWTRKRWIPRLRSSASTRSEPVLADASLLSPGGRSERLDLSKNK